MHDSQGIFKARLLQLKADSSQTVRKKVVTVSPKLKILAFVSPIEKGKVAPRIRHENQFASSLCRRALRLSSIARQCLSMSRAVPIPSRRTLSPQSYPHQRYRRSQSS